MGGNVKRGSFEGRVSEGSGSYIFGEVGYVFLVYLEFSVYEVELIEVCPYTPDGLLVPCHDKKVCGGWR